MATGEEWGVVDCPGCGEPVTVRETRKGTGHVKCENLECCFVGFFNRQAVALNTGKEEGTDAPKAQRLGDSIFGG